MPAFTLYGSPGSSNTNRIRLVLAEGGITDYEMVMLNLPKGEQRTPENLARHPWGKVPSIVFPDGLTLFESRAISRYLAQKYSIPLLPDASDSKSSALFEQALAVEAAYFADPAGKISFEKHVKKMQGAPADEAVVAQAVSALDKFFDVAEKQLLKEGYMAGKDITLADLYYVPLMQRLVGCGFGGLIEVRPAVQTWWTKLQERPSFKEVMVPKK